MGEIIVNVALENPLDETKRGSITVKGVVNPRMMLPVLPQNVVDALGIKTQRMVQVCYADNRREKRPVAGPVTIRIGDRFMNTDCIVGPAHSEALVGHVVLASLDLIADYENQTLSPRPESPDIPLLNLK